MVVTGYKGTTYRTQIKGQCTTQIKPILNIMCLQFPLFFFHPLNKHLSHIYSILLYRSFSLTPYTASHEIL